MTDTRYKLDDDVDSLFKVPLSEFTAARNELAARLKKGGRGNEADFVKSLVKPSVSAWTVNQLYWEYRDEFDQLIAAGERFRQAQSARHDPQGHRSAAVAQSLADRNRPASSGVRDHRGYMLNSHRPRAKYSGACVALARQRPDPSPVLSLVLFVGNQD